MNFAVNYRKITLYKMVLKVQSPAQTWVPVLQAACKTRYLGQLYRVLHPGSLAESSPDPERSTG